ncbi:MAG: hypothetical protein ACRENA_15845, partial [Vulcanimicrobiaceae bacterium]
MRQKGFGTISFWMPLVFCAGALLAGCGGGGGTSTASVPSGPRAPGIPAAPGVTPTPSGQASPPGQPGTPTPVPTSSSSISGQSKLLYVALGGNAVSQTEPSRIEAFPLNTSGNIAPVKTITQYQNDMPAPVAIAFDTSGNLYVGNIPYPGLQGSTSFITVFAPGASGSAIPIRTIGAGQNSTLGSAVIEGLAVDAGGYVYVAMATSNENCTGTTSSSCTATDNDSILVFAPNTNGNVPPVRTIDSSACFEIGELAATSTGALVVSCVPPNYPGEPYALRHRVPMASSQTIGEIETFAPGASGNATPLTVISGSNTQLTGAGSVALSPLGSIVVLPRAVQTGY